MTKCAINLETDKSDDIAQFLGVLFNMLVETKDDKTRDETCLQIGKLIFGLVLLDRISFSITDPDKIKNKNSQDVHPNLH